MSELAADAVVSDRDRFAWAVAGFVINPVAWWVPFLFPALNGLLGRLDDPWVWGFVFAGWAFSAIAAGWLLWKGPNRVKAECFAGGVVLGVLATLLSGFLVAGFVLPYS